MTGPPILHGMVARPALVIATLMALPVLTACSTLPDIPPLPDSGRAAPALLPMDEMLASVAAPRATDATSDALAARAARLRARANLMRGPVLDPDTRARLAAAIVRGDA